MDYRAALVDFYRKHNPLKLVEVDALLRKYKGREEELLHALRVKYKVNEQGESIEEPTPPPPPPAEERPAPHMEAIINETPPEEPVREESPRMEAIRNEPEQEEEKPAEAPTYMHRTPAAAPRTVTDYSSDYKGNTAAERAAYWKKELEKREQERRGKKGVQETKTAPPPKAKAAPATEKKQERMKVVREPDPVAEEEEEVIEIQEDEGDNRKKLAIIVIVLVLVAVAAAAVFFSAPVQEKLGFSGSGSEKGAQVEEKTKKTGLDPGVMTGAGDSAETSESSGGFEVDREEESEEDSAPSVEDAINERPSSSGSQTSREEPSGETDSTPITGEAVRKKFYIGCAAVASKQTAENMATEMRRKGFDNAGYFYIPDYDPAGKDLYRVYVGPFDTHDSAEEMAVNVRAESPSAYTFYLK